jgi:autotransporter-associated beta strand protein
MLILIASPALAAYTVYQWKGTQSSDWANTNNWISYKVAPTGSVTETRLEVLNTTSKELIYDASMGTTVYAGTGGTGLNPRSVIIGLVSSGQLRITGGILEGRGYSTGGGVADLIGGNGATGRMIVDGGTYLRTNDVPSGTTEFGAEMVIGYSATAGTVGELIVSNGLASVRHIVLNFNNGASVSSIIRLDGGSLETFAIRSGGASGTRAVYFNGGTLRSGFLTPTDWITSSINTWVQDGGAIFDTAGYSCTLLSHLTPYNASTGGLVKNGTGLLNLIGTNTYTGTTTINNGVLHIEHGNALGTSASGTVVANGARLEMAGGFTVSGENLTISGNGAGSGYGALLSVAGINNWGGPVTLGATQTRLGAYNADLIVSGSIGDNGNNYDLLIRSASGNLTDTVTLSGANTYGGRTIIYQGAVKLDGGDNRLPLGTILQLGFYGTGNLLMGQLDLNGRNQELAGLEVNANMPDTQPTLRAQQIVKNDSGTAAMLTLNNSADYNFAGRLVGNLGLTKKGSGMFTLSSTNTYSGVTAVSNGTLRLTRSDCLSTNAPISIDTSASAKLDLAFTGTQTVSTLSVDGKVLFRNFIYNAANLPAALSGTGNLRTTEGPILGAMVQFF